MDSHFNQKGQTSRRKDEYKSIKKQNLTLYTRNRVDSGLDDTMIKEQDQIYQRKMTKLEQTQNQIRYLSTKKRNDIFAGILTMVILFFSYIQVNYKQNEIFWENGNKVNDFVNLLRIAIQILNLVLLILIFRHYQIIITFVKQSRKNANYRKIHSVNQIKRPKMLLLVETFVNIFAPIPFNEWEFEFEQMEMKTIYSFDDMIVSLMFFKVYLIIRSIVNMQDWITATSIRIWQLKYSNYHSTDANAMFALKCTVKTFPFQASGIIFMLSSVLFGLVLRIYERAYPDSAYEFIWNGFWTFVVTTTTIGYGEIYPKSHLGRFIAMISCILGMCMISLLVISFANFIEFENDQQDAFEALKVKQYQKKIKTQAAIIIQKWFRLKIARKVKNKYRLLKVWDYTKSLQHFRVVIAPIRPTPSFQELIEATMKKSEKVFAAKVVKDEKSLDLLQKASKQLCRQSEIQHGKFAEIEKNSIKMLNLGFAILNCKINPVQKLSEINNNSVIYSLIKRYNDNPQKIQKYLTKQTQIKNPSPKVDQSSPTLLKEASIPKRRARKHHPTKISLGGQINLVQDYVNKNGLSTIKLPHQLNMDRVISSSLSNFTSTIWTVYTPLAIAHQSTNLGQGFPSYQPPQFVKQALADAALGDQHQYTRSQGHLGLVQRLAQYYGPKYNREIDPMTEIVVTPGASGALMSSAMGMIQEGDEVVIFEPYFDIYVPQIKLAGGTVKTVELKVESQWGFDINEFEASFNERTTMLLLTNPHNPTGKVFSREEIQAIADVLVKFPKVQIVVDEVYEHLVFDGFEMHHLANFNDLWERTLTIGSSGKLFSVTGWKMGWGIGGKNVVKKAAIGHQWDTFCCNTPIQVAIQNLFDQSLQPFEEYPSYIEYTRMQFQQKRDELIRILQEQSNNIKFNPIIPQGGYFLVAKFDENNVPSDLPGEERIDFEYTKWLTINKKFTVLPMSAFYSSENQDKVTNYVRIALCKNWDDYANFERILKE